MTVSKTNYWKLGLFVVSAIGLAVVTLFWLGARRLNRELVPQVTYFDESVQGLEVGAPVKFRGVTIGNVSDITIAEDRRLVEVSANLYRAVLERLGLDPRGRVARGEEVPSDLRVQLSSTGITGVKFLLVDFFDEAAHPPIELPFDEPAFGYVSSTPSTLKSLEDGVRVLVSEVPGLVTDVQRLARAMADQLEGLDTAGLSSRASDALDRVEAVAATFHEGERSERIDRVLTSADEALKLLTEVLAELGAGDHTVASALAGWDAATSELGTSVADAELGETARSVREAASAFGSLAREAGTLPHELSRDLAALRETLEALRSLAQYLERDPGSLLRGRASNPSGPQ